MYYLFSAVSLSPVVQNELWILGTALLFFTMHAIAGRWIAYLVKNNQGHPNSFHKIDIFVTQLAMSILYIGALYQLVVLGLIHAVQISVELFQRLGGQGGGH